MRTQMGLDGRELYIQLSSMELNHQHGYCKTSTNLCPYLLNLEERRGEEGRKMRQGARDPTLYKGKK
jgi:hypothetical protein